MELLKYFAENKEQILVLLVEHIKLISISVSIAILIGVPAGILISYVKKLNKPLLGLANVMQAIPSMALLGFMIPFLGIGAKPAITAVVIYSLLPIIKNTFTGISNINPQMIESAKGIGLTKFQILRKIQIPLALPVIMAGVRISSVTAVGFMTIAAFIGAGGLGFLVFSGIRSVNNIQILAGAIPACLLALTVDFLGATVEKLVTPISLQKGVTKKNRLFSKIILSAFTGLIMFTFIFTEITKEKKSEKIITIGSKDYTEQQLLGNLVAELIERNTDIQVNRKLNLGGSQVCFSAMETEDIDMYVEYTGTAYAYILKNKPISDVQKVYNVVKRDLKKEYNIETLKQMGFNNTNVVAVRRDIAEKYNLKTISDFAKVSKHLKIGSTFEFINREDGLSGLKKEYNFEMGKTIAIDGSPRYISLVNGNTDATNAYSTDALLKKFKLVTLKDDKSFIPPFYATPIIRTEVLRKYPEIVPIIEKLGDSLNEETMIGLNYKVDELGENSNEVALEYLREKGFIK